MTTSADPSGRPSRRQVLYGTGAGLAVGLLPGPVAAAAQPARAEQDVPVLGEYDVVVVGAGAAGMTAALTAAERGLSCVVVEKAPTYGGSAARSGAGIWIPNNPVILAAGVPDTPAKAAAYLAAVVGDDVPADRQQAFLAHGPAMISFVMDNSPLTFRWGYSDYYRSSGLSRSESAQPHAPNGLGRTGPRRTQPRGGDTHPVRGPGPGGRFPARSGQMGTARGDGEALNHHSGGAGAPHAGAVPGVPDHTITLIRTAQEAASPEADHHTIELNRPSARSPASS
ncbi:FAD-dependent oxidoreductase [Streptomyces sp. ISL-98]|uniref:FAD-dependent oxidoreductase n=1 Tax=Streptomyces sp. ISL-98 TaxID=2819192 RepID=UPI0025576D42|nr:FAD-dependent oxidoreductase [Streptomyces sp. ISL-98]